MKKGDKKSNSRGYPVPGAEAVFEEVSREGIYLIYPSLTPSDRCAAICSLRRKCSIEAPEYAEFLLRSLSLETALYPRLEISRTLEQGTVRTANLLLGYLGKIGNNQHREVPERISKKTSYPLPRDLTARILGKMSPDVADTLFEHLIHCERNSRSELLDACGFLVFYSPGLAQETRFCILEHIYRNEREDELIVWKLCMCCGAFPLERTRDFLKRISHEIRHPVILDEINKSLERIGKRRDASTR